MQNRISSRLKLAGELKDGVLVMAAIFYFCGYIVWAINAYRNDLGLLPALDFQYFVAGVPPVLILVGLYYLVVGTKLLRKMVRQWIGSAPKGGKLYLSLAMAGLGVIAFILTGVNDAEWFKTVFPQLSRSSWFVLSLVLIIAVSGFFSPSLEQLLRSRRAASALREGVLEKVGPSLMGSLRALGLVYAVLALIVIAATSLVFVIGIYQKIPQEFGGARPQYACLDVVKAQISNETIAVILPTDANKASEPVVRSLRVEVLFSGSDVMLVRSQGRVYRIAKNTVQTVTNCN